MQIIRIISRSIIIRIAKKTVPKRNHLQYSLSSVAGRGTRAQTAPVEKISQAAMTKIFLVTLFTLIGIQLYYVPQL